MARTKLAPYQLSLNLEDVDNVVVESVESGELLKWNGTEWVNQTLAEAGVAIATHDHDGVYMKDLVDDTSPQLGGELDAGENTVGFTERVNTSSSGSATIDWTKSNHQVITLTENTTLTFISPSKPCNLTLRIKQDSVGGWTVTMPTLKTPSGIGVSFSTTANAEDLMMLYFDGTNYIATVLQDIK